LALAIATLLQRRFFNSFAPAFSLVMAWNIVMLLRALPGWVADRRVGPVSLASALQAGTVVLCLWLFAPTLVAYRLPVSNLVQTARGASMTVPKNEISRRVLLDAASWLNDNTPPTASPLDPAGNPEYGILAPWGYGHLLKYVARRPTLVGNFGDDVGEANLRRATAYFASREPDAVRILEDLSARYVLVQTLGEVPRGWLEGEAMRKRLSRDDSPGLEHHRLLYESPLDERQARIGRSQFRIFERVEGARLMGSARPGASVQVRLGYRSNRGRPGRFESATTADADGRYEIRLPYATRGAPPGVATDPAYQVASDGHTLPVPVREQDVQSGATVTGPSFR
jgi:asparagine N-glycosylation enzyme membrane subunit Stt3